MAPTRVSGDLYYDLDGQIGEIKRQLRQKEGYPFDPMQLVEHLQAAIEGNLVDRHGRLFSEGGRNATTSTFTVLGTIQRGKHTSYEASRKVLEATGCRVSDWGDDILKRVDFTIGPEEFDLVAPSVAELGYPNGSTRRQIYERAFELGLEKVPGWAGPVLRETYQDQPSGEWLLIGMEPVAASDGNLSVFHVGRRAGDFWLDSNRGHPGHFWYGHYRWVFALRK